MKNPKEVKLSRGAVYLTTVVSVSLLLLIIGAVALLGIAADRETQRLKENVELSIVLKDSVGDSCAAVIMDSVARLPYINTTRLVTKEQALRNWNEDTGEDLQQLFGVNPLSPEIVFTLKAAFTGERQMAAVKEQLERSPEVEGVAAPDARFVDAMNRNITTALWILCALAAVLVAISFVLINNTVHLTIYSRRFTIHTMQLVGASDAFVRRPLLSGNFTVGVISGLIASGALACAMAALPAQMAALVSWQAQCVVYASLVVAGGLICLIAAYLSSTRYLRKSYDELFK